MTLQAFPVQGYPSGADESAPGALIEAENMIISRPGVASRRGPYTKFNGSVPNLPVLGVGQHGQGTLSFIWNPSSGGPYVGNLTKSLQLAVGAANRVGPQFLRGIDDILSGVEFPSAGGVFFPTLPAMACNEVSGSLWNAGCPRSADISWVADKLYTGTGSGTTNSAEGFNPGDTVAYRATFAYDRPGVTGSPVTVTGPPSGRFIYARRTSDTGVTCPVLQVRIPSDFPAYYSTNNTTPFTAYLYVYRSILTAAAALALTGVANPAPTDEMQLVFKTIVQSTDITNGYIQFTDVCPNGGEGPALYSNPSLGGSNVERWLPPQANSVATYKGTAFYGGVQDRVSRTNILFTGTPQIYGTSFTVNAGVITVNIGTGNTLPYMVPGMIFSLYKASGGGGVSGDYVINGTVTYVSGTGILSIPVAAAPTNNTYTAYYGTCGRVQIALNDQTTTTWTLDASFNVATTGASGKFLVEVPFNTTTYNLEISTKAYVQKFAAALCTGINLTCTRSGYVVTGSNLATGSLESAVITLEIRLTAVNTSCITTNIYTTVSALGSPTNFYDLASRVVPTTQAQFTANTNRVVWGVPGIYDHFCPAYSFDIGSPQREILKLVATRNALYVFKEDGLWVIDGDGSGGSNWTLTFITSDVIPLSPSSIDVYEDAVYSACYTGVVEIMGATVNLISGPIVAEYSDIMKAKSIPAAFSGGEAVCAYTCIASYFDQALTVSIPVFGTGHTVPMHAVAILTYSFVTQQWLVGYQYSVQLFTTDPNLGTQIAAPICARPAFRVQSNTPIGSLLLDTVQKAILRFCNSLGTYISQHAIESGNISSGVPLAPYVYTMGSSTLRGSNGRLLPYTDDSQVITLVYAGTRGSYYFVGPLVQPEASIQYAGLLSTSLLNDTIIPILSGSFTSDSTPEMRTNITISEATPGQYNGIQYWLLCPPGVNMVFAPVGNGIQAYNFNQAAIMQTRRSSAKNLTFTFWLDTASPFPNQPEVIASVSPAVVDTVPRNVIRSDIPDSMTRGSRLNIQVQNGFSAGERVEFSQLLVDFAPIAGEEISY